MSRNHQEHISETRLKPSNRKENEALTTRQRIIKYLTLAQRCSAPFLSIYVGIHLSAPIAANFGGSVLSTKMMVRANRRVCISTDDDGSDSAAAGEGVLSRKLYRVHPAMDSVGNSYWIILNSTLPPGTPQTAGSGNSSSIRSSDTCSFACRASPHPTV
jgi:hypothetical protein